MVVKNIKLLFSFLLCMINFLIIQPSLASCETVDIKIFGIKVKTNEVGEMTKEKEIGYIILNYLLSGLCAIAVVFVILFFCCIVACCCKKKDDDLERGIHHEDDEEEEEEEEDDDDANDQNPNGTEKSSNDERNKSEGNEK
ncbi:hypothetical protein C1646_709055 [Rhizophagus diaphanus]|nr:hypothetical protein C1646_709055 [Rhizophagus diaphanus] [Rhizophagus sp. MUCL 43196]